MMMMMMAKCTAEITILTNQIVVQTGHHEKFVRLNKLVEPKVVRVRKHNKAIKTVDYVTKIDQLVGHVIQQLANKVNQECRSCD